MELRRAGRSGLILSVIGLGTLTWGRDTDEFEAHDQVDALLAAGGNWVDTAGAHGDGAAEQLLGQVIANVGRDQLVVSSRSGGAGATGSLSRKAVRSELEASLRRLRLDHLDVWQLAGPDGATPLEEVAATLDLVLGSGLASYVAVGNLPAWQLAAIHTRMERRESLVLGHYEYSLLQREAEDDVVAATAALGVGLVAWSPLGRGVLSGKYRRSVPPDSRAASPHLGAFTRERMGEVARPIVEAVVAAADGLGVTPTEIALAWAISQPGVTSALTGARTVGQLQVALRAATLDFPSQVREALSEVSATAARYPTSAWQLRRT